jgi:3-deoxy-manno-octulosonate cytidylyltransferase (CMP-KDO synthetase)
VGIIPARYASTRLPGKPLLSQTGKPLIQHVYEQARQARALSALLVATDDRRISDAVQNFGGQAVMTDPAHRSGTDRIAEAARSIDADIVVNVQGDEPDLDPAAIDAVVKRLQEDRDIQVATAATRCWQTSRFLNPHVVKVVIDRRGRALYFSRSPIPGSKLPPAGEQLAQPFLWHLGLYAYRKPFLMQYSQLPPSALEAAEELEQLRVLEAGYAVGVVVADYRPSGIDTPEEYAEFVRQFKLKAGSWPNTSS